MERPAYRARISAPTVHDRRVRRSVSSDSERALKLYVEEIASPPTVEGLPNWNPLCAAVLNLTGWSLSWANPSTASPCELELAAGVPDPPVARESVSPLVQSLGGLMQELQRTRKALWEREAELAAGVPVRARPEEAQHLASRLESILRSGVEAVQAQAAGLYLLDDSTTELKLRAVWGLPKDRFLNGPRPLRGSIADLEALLGHAVVLEEPVMVRRWKSPEDYPSAVCVPISSPTMPLGTLWIYGGQPREYTTAQTGILEIVAGRIAAELEREVLLTEASRQHAARPNSVGSAETWRRSRQPSIEPLVDGWEFAGWSSPWTEYGGGFFDWSVLPDGNLSLSVGQGHGKGDHARLNGAALHAAFKVLEHNHGPRALLRSISDSFWSASSGDQWASLASVQGDPETGTFTAATAGSAWTLVVQPKGIRSWTKPCTALGSDPDFHFSQRKLELQPGETMLLASAPGLDHREHRERLLRRLAPSIQNPSLSAEHWVRMLRSEPLFSGQGVSSSSLLVARRLPSKSSGLPT